MRAYVEEYLAETESLLADDDQRGFYKNLKGTVGLDGRKAKNEQFIRDEDGTLPRDNVRIRERWAGFFGNLLITKPSELTEPSAPYFHNGRWHHRLGMSRPWMT